MIYALLNYRRRCADAVIATLNDMHRMAFGRHSRAVSRASPARNLRTQDSWAWLSCRNPQDRYEKASGRAHAYREGVDEGLPRGSDEDASVIRTESCNCLAAQRCESCPHCATTGLMDLVDYGLMVRSRMSESLNKVGSFLYPLLIHALTLRSSQVELHFLA